MLKKHLICYLDILGTEKKLKNSESTNDLIKLINEAYDEMIDICSVTSKSINEFNKTDKCTIKIKIFSDNVLIAMEFEDNDNTDVNLSAFFSAASCFQYAFLKRGKLLRGGITLGDLFINDIFTLGGGLVDAYKLESEIAIYPRIIIDNSIINNKNIMNRHKFLINEGRSHDFKKDKDDFYYIDCLSLLSINQVTYDYAHNQLSPVKDELIKEFDDNTVNKKIIQKRNWFKNYFDEFCDKNKLYDLKFNQNRVIDFEEPVKL